MAGESLRESALDLAGVSHPAASPVAKQHKNIYESTKGDDYNLNKSRHRYL
jgi:hypothetical protein